MPTSYNGWPASPDPNAIDAVWCEPVPGRRFRVQAATVPLFAYLIRRFDAEVDGLLGGVLDEWSYAYRVVRGGTELSNHASATAVDLNATKYPMGTRLMTDEQRRRVRWIVHDCRGQIRWGGEWSTRPDEMHFEIAPGTSSKTIRDARIRMGLHPDGRVLQVQDLNRDHRIRVPLIKRALAQQGLYPKRPVYTRYWVKSLVRAWDAWTRRHPRLITQAALDRLGADSGLF